MAYQDEKGHFTTKENDGGPCHHGSGNGAKKKKYDSRGKSLYDFDKENPGEGSHNNIINALRNSAYDSIDAAMKDAEKYNLTDDQKEYVHEYAKHVFGEEFDDDYEEEFTGREPGGVKGDLERAGFEKINIVDDKTLTFEGPDTKTWTIKENENAGFDVYDSTGKKVLDDVNAVRENIATKILQREQNPMKDFDMSDFDVEDARPHETRLHDLNLTDSEVWNMAYKYIGNDKLEKLAEQLDLDSPQDLRTSDMIKYMSDDDIADMLNYNGYDEDEDWEDESQEEYEDRIKPKAEKFKKQLDDAGYQLKQNEYGVEKKPSEGIPHKPVDMPKYHRENGHIVIDEGPHKGESYDTEEDYYNSVRSEDNLNPQNPKYNGFKRSDITNAKLVDQGKTVHNYDKDEDETLSIIEYIPYGALQDGDNRKLYGVVKNYDGSDAPKIGAMVSPSLESAKEDLQHQLELSEQGSEHYLRRGKWDEEWFNMLNDKEYDFSDEDRKKYSEKYGWDFTKPWKEQKHVKGK